jgi:hypothetical protein
MESDKFLNSPEFYDIKRDLIRIYSGPDRYWHGIIELISLRMIWFLIGNKLKLSDGDDGAIELFRKDGSIYKFFNDENK